MIRTSLVVSSQGLVVGCCIPIYIYEKTARESHNNKYQYTIYINIFITIINKTLLKKAHDFKILKSNWIYNHHLPKFNITVGIIFMLTANFCHFDKNTKNEFFIDFHNLILHNAGIDAMVVICHNNLKY